MRELINCFKTLIEKEQKLKLIGIFAMMVFGAILDTIGVSVIVPFVAIVLNPSIIETNRFANAVVNKLNISSSTTFITVCSVMFIVLYVLKNAFLLCQINVQTNFTATNKFRLQQKVLGILLSKPYSYFLYAKSSYLQRMVYINISLAYTLLSNLLTAFSEVIVALLLGLTILLIDWKMTLVIMLVLFSVGTVIVLLVRPIIKKAGAENLKYSTESTKWLLEGVAGIKEIKVYRRERFFENHFERYGSKIVGSEKIATTSQSVPRLLVELACIVSMILYLLLAVKKGDSIDMLIPTMSALAMAAVRLIPSANRIIGAMNSISYTLPSLKSLTEFLEDSLDEITIESNAQSENRLIFEKSIVFDHVSFSYDNSSVKILDDACMTIHPGSSVGIVGVSGSGKTTSVDLLLGLLSPQEGNIFVDGKNIATNYLGWIKNVGYIPQSIFLMDGTIRDNVAFAADDVDDAAINIALAKACLLDFVNSLPDGINTEIGERGVRLSGGQRQRIGIARALLADPAVLVFDEATSALDNETEASIMNSIECLHGEKTIIIIAHRLQTIEKCDFVYQVENGKIVLIRGDTQMNERAGD